jgi:uncharacterized protein (AIM24 family)
VHTTLAQFNENHSGDRFSLQNTQMLRVLLDEGPVHVRRGAVVGAQGEVAFDNAIIAGLDLVVAEGSGQLFLGERAHDVHLVHLENGETVTAAGERLLAFTSDLGCAVAPVDGADQLVNARLSGTGWLAVVSEGSPVLLAVAEHGTIAAARAVIAWSEQAEVETAPEDAGPSPRLAFRGGGWVLVQPSSG